MKALSIEIVVITTQINMHITIVAPVPDPTQKIIIGPSAILGKLLRIIKYGSKIFLNLSFHQSRTAITNPIKVARINPKIVSYREVQT